MPKQLVVLFDFDGVIVDHSGSERVARRAMNKQFFKWNQKAREELTPAKAVRIFELADSVRNVEYIRNIYLGFRPYLPSRVRRYLFFLYMGVIRNRPQFQPRPIEGVHEVLARLKERGAYVGIVSSSNEKRIRHLLDNYDLARHVDVLVSREIIKAHALKLKPNPDPVLFALVLLKRTFGISIDKDRVYFVGDLPFDVQAGLNAGVHTIAVLSGHGYRAELENLHPDKILPDVSALLKKLPDVT